MLTRRCNISCSHCSVASSPSLKDQPSDGELERYVEESIRSGVRAIQFTGGEPLLREDLLLRLLANASAKGVTASVTSNGSWGETFPVARRKLRRLLSAGMKQLTISYDPFHEKFLPIERIEHIARAAQGEAFTFQVNVTRLRGDEGLTGIVHRLESFHSVELRIYDVQRVGRALKFDTDTFRRNLEGFCNACERATISDDGRLMACNGPSYFSKTSSPLIVGSMADSSMEDLLDRHANDDILEAIRVQGPLYLKRLIDREKGGETTSDETNFTGLCDLCLHLTSDAESVSTLRDILNRPEEVARRVSMRRLIQQKRNRSEFNKTYVNRSGITKVMLEEAIPGVLLASTQERENLVRRQDLDWNRLSRLIRANGLARALMPFCQDEIVKDSAPRFFQADIEASVRLESVKLIEVEKVLRKMDAILLQCNVEGVLLKGSALMILCLADDERVVCKTPGDIDLYVIPEKATLIWDTLREAGFEEVGVAGNSLHLPGLRRSGVTVEIHTSIMGRRWSLPENEMLASSQRVKGWQALRILSPEANILHISVHLVHEGYTHGLKTFWAFRYLLGAASDHGLDIDTLLRWVGQMSLSRGFWIPLQIAMDDLNLAFPEDLRGYFPEGRRQSRLLGYARNRVFTLLDHRQGGFLMQKLPHDLLLADNVREWLEVLAEELSPSGMKTRIEYARTIGWRRYLSSKIRLIASSSTN